MADIEKVKTGIFEMLQRNTWKDIDDERHRFQPVLNDALKLLKDSVPQSVADQIRWERDTALSQLKEIGKGLGEKMDDVKPKAKQPRLLTLWEVSKTKYPEDVFCEIKDENRVFAVTAPVPVQWRAQPVIRYWTARPTDEQRKAEPWEGR